MRKKFVPLALRAWLFALNLSSSLLFAICFSSSAHAAARTYRIGFVGATPVIAAFDLKPFRDRLRELGYAEGQDFTLEQRYWENKLERLPALLGDLVALNSDVDCHEWY